MRVPTGSTRVAGLFGFPARYSMSPALHNAAYEAMGIDAVYAVFPVAPGHERDAVAAIRALDLLGVSVTLPHKEAVIAHLDGLGDEAARLGATNTIVRDGDRLVGHNTDGAGFVDALAHDCGFDPAGARCVVIGAGGAARAVIAALGDAGAKEVVVINRSADRAATAAALAGTIGRNGSHDDLAAADLVVNATPVGMAGDTVDQCPAPTDTLHAGQVVADLIYHPGETRFLYAARERGAVTTNGLGMLIHQAAAQIRLWTGQEPPLDVMRDAVATRS